MSRFRPGRRQDDPHAAGDFYDGDAYEGDPYDDETYPDGPYPGQAPEPAGPAAQQDSGGPRPAGRPHSSRFRRDKDEVLLPTSVISPGSLVGGPRPDAETDDPYGGAPQGEPGRARGGDVRPRPR